jgi:hypothetical protein
VTVYCDGGVFDGMIIDVTNRKSLPQTGAELLLETPLYGECKYYMTGAKMNGIPIVSAMRQEPVAKTVVECTPKERKRFARIIREEKALEKEARKLRNKIYGKPPTKERDDANWESSREAWMDDIEWLRRQEASK